MPQTIWVWLSIFLQNFAETFLLICICHAFLGAPIGRALPKYAGIAVTAVLYCLVLNLVVLPAPVRYLTTVLVFFSYTLCFGGSLAKKLFAIACDFFFDAIFSLSVYWILDSLAGVSAAPLSMDSLLYAVPNTVVLIALGFAFLAGSKTRGNTGALPAVQWVMLMLYPAVAAVTVLSFFYLSTSTDALHWLMLLDSLLLLAAMVVHFVLMFLLNRQNALLKQSSLLRQEVLLGKKKTEDLLEAYNEQRRMTHDFNNYLRTIRGLLQRGQAGEAEKLIDGVLPTAYLETPLINTGNPLVDTLLCQKYNQAKKEDILVFFQLGNLAEFPVPAEDMVVLIGNLFDNAIEGSRGVDNAEIQVKIQYDEDSAVVSFRNRVSRPVRFGVNGLPASTKTEPGHGYGLQNVLALFKNNGMLHSITCQDGWFQVTGLKYLSAGVPGVFRFQNGGTPRR